MSELEKQYTTRLHVDGATYNSFDKMKKELIIKYGATNVKVVHHLETDALGKAIQSANLVICRSGYTTLMELMPLKKKMMLIPTPGQTEQEYLAAIFMQRKWAMAVEQNRFALSTVLAEAEQFEFKQHEVQLFDSNSLTDLLLL